MQEPSNLGNIALVSICVRVVSTTMGVGKTLAFLVSLVEILHLCLGEALKSFQVRLK